MVTGGFELVRPASRQGDMRVWFTANSVTSGGPSRSRLAGVTTAQPLSTDEVVAMLEAAS